MHMFETHTVNDTGLHPVNSYVLAEHIDIQANGSKIVIPQHLRDKIEPTMDNHRIYVLEDSRDPAPDKRVYLPPGTIIETIDRTGFKYRGRNLMFLRPESVVAWREV